MLYNYYYYYYSFILFYYLLENINNIFYCLIFTNILSAQSKS